MRGVLGWVLTSLVLGGIVHIAAMLVIPTLAPQSAFSRFETTLQPNLARALPVPAPDQMPFPFASPDVLYVMCRYDVSTTPVRITSPSRFTYWSVGIYEPDGGNFFHVNSMQSTSADTDVILLGRGQEADLGENTLIVRATHDTGLVIVRFFMRDRTLAESLSEQAAATRCTSFEPPPPDLPPPAPAVPNEDIPVAAPVTTGASR